MFTSFVLAIAVPDLDEHGIESNGVGDAADVVSESWLLLVFAVFIEVFGIYTRLRLVVYGGL